MRRRFLIAGAVVSAAVLAVVAEGLSSHSSAGSGVSGATCSKALSYLSSSSSYVSTGDRQDLYSAAQDAWSAVYDAGGATSQLETDVMKVSDDTLAWQNGNGGPSYVTADLKSVYSDCGKTYSGS